VTDNRLYAHALAKTVDQINNVRLSWADSGESDGNPRERMVVEASDSEDSDDSEGGGAVVKKTMNSSSVCTPTPVRSGEPGERGDHLETDEGSSYFSRMWKNGSKSRVWNLVLVKK
jgi:hypothetical protein